MKAAVLLLALGCAPDEPLPPRAEGAPGTVLLVEGLPLIGAELEDLCADIHALYPEFSPVHVRRIALTNEFLPRLAARAQAPEAWARARRACEQALEDPGALAPLGEEGTFHGLGVALWSAARRLPVGAWGPPTELAGRWLALRLDERVEDADLRRERLRVAIVEFPFLDPELGGMALEHAIDRSRLTIVDPEFGAAVPEAWKHRMRADEP